MISWNVLMKISVQYFLYRTLSCAISDLSSTPSFDLRYMTTNRLLTIKYVYNNKQGGYVSMICDKN